MEVDLEVDFDLEVESTLRPLKFFQKLIRVQRITQCG